ncbi:MAG: sugar transferase [Pseudomonadota bacterium]
MYHQVSKTPVGAPVDLSTNDVRKVVFRGAYGRWGKRALDLTLALLAAPFAAAIVGVLGLLIGRDHGPMFYGHTRVGRDGRRFTCWKLRTMVVDADARLKAHLAADPAARSEWNETQKLQRDPRVTRLGGLLRAASLDELPQIWNILRGDMSFVGPRPFTPDQQTLYHGRGYYALRPGLSGLWQVEQRNDGAFAARAVYDALYAREMSLGLDLRIIVKTLGVVLRGTGR